MNSEQLQEWLTELNSLTKDELARLEDPEACAQFLHDNGDSTEILMDYLARNYADHDLTEPIFGQILSGYFRGGAFFDESIEFEAVTSGDISISIFFFISVLPCCICFLITWFKQSWYFVYCGIFWLFYLNPFSKSSNDNEIWFCSVCESIPHKGVLLSTFPHSQSL